MHCFIWWSILQNILMELIFAFFSRYVKEGYIFRSGTLDSLTTDQVGQLIDTHKIKTILDLRTRCVLPDVKYRSTELRLISQFTGQTGCLPYSLEAKNNLPIDKSFPTMGLDTVIILPFEPFTCLITDILHNNQRS